MIKKPKPLEGLRVLELGMFIAGPFCSHVMADFGAEVIKIEPPGQGDPMRTWGDGHKEDKSLWWLTQSRNKKCITLNLKDPKGLEMAKELVAKSDIVVENFRPGKLEDLGLGYEELKKINPGIVLVRISGYGQTGPYSARAGFGGGAEAIGGLRHLTGYPDRPPTRVGIAIGDTVAAIIGALGAVMAIYNRTVRGGEGQVVDVALYEAVFSLMDASLPEFDKLGVVKQRSGTSIPKVAPSNIYETSDDKFIYIGANHDALFKRLSKIMGQPELGDDPRYSTHKERGERQQELDDMVNQWTKQHTMAELDKMLEEAGVPASPIYTIADIAKDPHYHAREMIREIEDSVWGKVKVPGIVPKLSGTPGDIEWGGPGLGEHNNEIYQEILGFTAEQVDELEKNGVI